MNVMVDFVVMLCKIFYFYLEALVRLFKPPPRKTISGQNVLITGGGRGIGRQLAFQFSKEGANIILWDLNKDDLKMTADDLKSNGVSVHTYVCDVTSRDAVKQTASDVRRDVGDVDILVNNAGVLSGKFFLDLGERDIRKSYEVNTISHFWTIQEFLPGMLDRRKGHVVTIASTASKIGVPLLTDYCASKFAAYGFTEALRSEVQSKYPKTGVNFTTVCPLFVNTSLIFGSEIKTRIEHRDRFGKILEADDVASATVDGVLRNTKVLYVPSRVGLITLASVLMPDKARSAMFEFLDIRFVPVQN